MQQVFYFDRDGRRLLGVFYPPEGKPSGKGIVLCNAFGKEYCLCLSQLVRAARILSSRGHAVLRFDYWGYADSSGAFEDATISTMRADTEGAIAEILARARVDELALLGVRFGCSIAALVAGGRSDVRRLILWEPMLKPWDYLFGELRQTCTMQTVLFREVKVTREQIVQNVLAGRPSLVSGYDFNVIDEGFPLGAKLITEARDLDLVERPPTLSARTLIVNIRKKEGPPPKPVTDFAARLAAAGVECTVETAFDPCTFWKYDNMYATTAPEVYGRTVAWLEG